MGIAFDLGTVKDINNIVKAFSRLPCTEPVHSGLNRDGRTVCRNREIVTNPECVCACGNLWEIDLRRRAPMAYAGRTCTHQHRRMHCI